MIDKAGGLWSQQERIGQLEDREVLRYEPTLLDAILRYWWLVLLMLAWNVVSAVLFNTFRSTEYVGTATLIVEDPREASVFAVQSSSDAGDPYVSDQVEMLRSAAVAERASQLVADQVPQVEITLQEWLQRANVSSTPGSGLISISFRHPDPLAAQAGANALAVAYQEVRREQAAVDDQAALDRIDAAVEAIDGDLTRIQNRIQTMQDREGPAADLEQQLEAAIQEVVQLQQQLTETTDVDQRAQINQRLSDLQLQFQMLQTIRGLETTPPELAALRQEQETLIDRRAELASRRNEIEIDSQLESTGVLLFSPAQSAASGRGETLRRGLAVAIVLGIVLGVGLAYMLALRRRRFTDRYQPEQVLEAPLLAEVPSLVQAGARDTKLPARDVSRSVAAEAFRFAAASIDVRMAMAGHRILAVVSGMVGDGKSVTAANVVWTAASGARRVLAVDGDFGDQGLVRLLLDGGARHGLTDVVEGEVDVEDALEWLTVGQEGRLAVVGKGTRAVSASDFFAAVDVRTLFEKFRNAFDLVLVDTPPLLQVAYASTVLRYVDAAIVIVQHGSDPATVRELADRLRFIGTPIMGYVYNRAPVRAEMVGTEASLRNMVDGPAVAVSPRRVVGKRSGR